MKVFRTIAALLLTMAIAAAAQADWQLDNDQSHLTFVTIKATHIAEVHRFTQLRGSLNAAGQADIEIALASVETNIPIRNERMQQMLFDTDLFPSAGITATFDAEMLAGLTAGDSRMLDISAQLRIKDSSIPVSVPVLAARLNAETLVVTSARPVLVSADSVGLTEGVEKLREVAGLPSISRAVPVSFVLTFRASPQI